MDEQNCAESACPCGVQPIKAAVHIGRRPCILADLPFNLQLDRRIASDNFGHFHERNMMKPKALLFILFILLSSIANAGYKEGKAAYLKEDFVTAVRELKQAADKGDPDAQSLLGFMYERGMGIKQSDSEALSLYRKAAAQGNAGAQYHLGVLYEEGRGVQKNETQALTWFKKSAEAGEQTAMHRIAEVYLNGELGEKRNPQLAKYWFERCQCR